MLRIHIAVGSYAHGLGGVGQPAKGPKGEPSVANHPGLVGWREVYGSLCPRSLKEIGQQRKFRSESAKFDHQIGLAATKDAIVVDAIKHLLMPPRLTAVVDRVEQRPHLLERVRAVRRLLRVVLIKPGVTRPELI